MTEQERLTLCDMYETRREFLLVLAARSPQMAKVWREFAARDAARIARLKSGGSILDAGPPYAENTKSHAKDASENKYQTTY